MNDKTLYWIIGIIVLMLFINSNTDLFATLESRFPQDIFLERSYDLGGSGTITLPEGTNYSEVRKIEITITGCGEDIGDLILNNEKIGSYSFTDCEFLTYPDGSGKAYTHYQTSTFTKLFYGSPTSPSLTSNSIDYEFTRTDENIKAKRMIVYEKVECISNSQCIRVAPFCSQTYHQCMPKVTSCTMEWAPVCCEGISYANPCWCSLVGKSISSQGLCVGDAPEEVKDDKGKNINIEDITMPIAQTNVPLFVWIGIFIIIVIIFYYKRNN